MKQKILRFFKTWERWEVKLLIYSGGFALISLISIIISIIKEFA